MSSKNKSITMKLIKKARRGMRCFKISQKLEVIREENEFKFHLTVPRTYFGN